LIAIARLCEHDVVMSTSALTLLNQSISSRPEPDRENLARYLYEHLDEIEADIKWEPSEELLAELERREQDCLDNPDDGAPWPEIRDRILNSR
jgi:hypothetical protein